MDLKKILMPSRSIEISVQTSQNDSPENVILRSMVESDLTSNAFRVIAPVYHGSIYPLHINDSLDVIVSVDEGNGKVIYSIPCKVIHRLLKEQLSLLTLEIMDEPKKVQRRQAFRVSIYNTYEYEFKGNLYTLVTKDISSTGMLAISTHAFKAGDTFSITFDANPHPNDNHSDDKLIHISCYVLSSEPESEIRRYINRIKFQGLNATESKKLLQYLYAKQTEMLHLNPDYEKHFKRLYDDLPVERRKKTDALQIRIQVMGLINVLLVLLSLIFLLYAQPTPLYGLDVFFGYQRPLSWNGYYMSAGLITVITSLLVSAIGIYLNSLRMKRKGDHYNRGILFSTFASICLLGCYIYFIMFNQVALF